MTELITFFINVGKLKGKKRRRWLVHQIKNSESTASHSFRVAILAWILGEKQGLNTEKIIKMALLHDLCEVFTKDETPYDPLLPGEIGSLRNQKKIDNVLKKWPTFSLQDKKNKRKRKAQREHKAFLKLVQGLPVEVKEELENVWLDFEKKLSSEARFVKQADRVENFLQGIEYWKEQGKIQKDLWARWAKENFDIPVLVEFVNAIEKKFFKKDILGKVRKKQEIDRILDFLMEIGKFKRLVRKGWILRRVKEPETVASHTFRLCVEAWILGKKKRLNIDKLLKMTLIHDLCELYAGSITPYDHFWPKYDKEQQELLKTWPRFFKNEERKKIIQKRKREYNGFLKILSVLPTKTQKEIINLWLEFDKGLSREGRFLKQLHKAENLLQALEYLKKDKNFPIGPWWIEAKEKIDDSLLVGFMNSLGVEFSEAK